MVSATVGPSGARGPASAGDDPKPISRATRPRLVLASVIAIAACADPIVTIPLIYAVGRQLVSRTAGLVAAAAVTLSPMMIYYSTEARAYALMVAFLAGSTLAMLTALRGSRRRWWVVYGGLSCLALYSHYTAAFPLAAQLLWLLWAHPGARVPAILANVGAAVAYVPWIPGYVADTKS